MLWDFLGGLMILVLPSADAGLIPDWDAKIPHALQPKNQNINQKQYCTKLNKDFKNGTHQKLVF